MKSLPQKLPLGESGGKSAIECGHWEFLSCPGQGDVPVPLERSLLPTSLAWDRVLWGWDGCAPRSSPQEGELI